MTWVILGAKGQFGQAMGNVLERAHGSYHMFGREEVDICNANELKSAFREFHPDVVVNAAAWTRVDDAESFKEQATMLNAIAPGLIAESCAEVGAKFVHISTDYIFSGVSNHPWVESSPANPRSVYGETKAEGERAVLDRYSENSYVVRTAWLYSRWGHNFAKTMARLALEGTAEIEVVDDQVGQPTSATDLAMRIWLMIEREIPSGIYHGTNSGKASWFDFAQAIFEECGRDKERIRPINAANYARAASRPSYSVLGHDNWLRAGLEPMRDWRDALRGEMPEIVKVVKELLQ